MINQRGGDDEKSTSWVEVVEFGLKDKCQQQFKINRL